MELGIDVGRNYTKGVSREQQKRFISLLSAAGEENLEEDRVTIVLENKTLKIGNSAFTFKKDNFVTVKDLLLTMAAMLGEGELNIITGIAIADYRERHKIKQMLQGYRNKIKINDVWKDIYIKNIDVFPQGAGALFSQVLNLEGKLYRSLEGLLGVIDIGFRDVNFCILENGKYRDDMSGSIPMGIYNAKLAILKSINRKYKMDLSLEELDLFPEPIETDEYAKLAKIISNRISAYWKNPQLIRTIFLAGGGTLLLDDYLKDEYPQSYLIPDPQFANANGFYKLAVMKYGSNSNKSDRSTKRIS